MAEYLSPDVYVEELSSGVKPIQAAGTSTAGFVGHAVKGPIGVATAINNFSAYQRVFGGFLTNGFLPYAVKAFFDEGGGSAYVVRTCHYDNAGKPTAVPATKTYAAKSDNAKKPLTVDASSPGNWGEELSLKVVLSGGDGNMASVKGTYSEGATTIDIGISSIADHQFLKGDVLEIAGHTQKYVLVSDVLAKAGVAKGAVISPGLEKATADATALNAPQFFHIAVFSNGSLAEAHGPLSMDSTRTNYVETRINDVSQLIRVTVKAADVTGVTDPRPPATPKDTLEPLENGDDGLSGLTASDYVGDALLGSGLHAFDTIDDVSIIAVPDATFRQVHLAGMTYCERRQDCFYLADTDEEMVTAEELLQYKTGQGLDGANAISSTYGALYAPWIQVFDPLTSGRRSMPPSGAIAGRYARVDATRGVHKAPAGVSDGKVNSALGLVADFVTADQEKLNPKGINLIRAFPGTGPVVWGARTVSSDPEWRYVNVRRLFIFLRQSILLGTTWVVFEPNDPTLWKSIERNVSAFLRLQWLSGALVGETPDDAFYVKCDAETNPPESIKLGRVITEIGVAPSKPAEFVIFRIMQHEGGGSATA